jgi:hypothetical protein
VILIIVLVRNKLFQLILVNDLIVKGLMPLLSTVKALLCSHLRN